MDSFEHFLDLQRKLLEAQLEIIKNYQPIETQPERTSKIDVIEKILRKAGRPVHISEIINIAQNDFQVTLDRDSTVSAIIKKIKANQGFIKTGPSTFALVSTDDRSYQ
jgi:hypothetical protein